MDCKIFNAHYLKTTPYADRTLSFQGDKIFFSYIIASLDLTYSPQTPRFQSSNYYKLLAALRDQTLLNNIWTTFCQDKESKTLNGSQTSVKFQTSCLFQTFL